MKQRIKALAAPVWAHRAEILVAVAWVVGWGTLTWGAVAIVQGEWAAAVWRLSLGLALVALPGVKLLWIVLRDGLYTLTRE